MTNVVDLRPHNEIWAQQFNEFKSEFINELDSLILAVEHVGSTSIEGISAKPILDIDIVINDVPQVCARYVCSLDSKELKRHLAFRDYLRQHPDEAKAYEVLKKSLAATVNTREEYTDGKTEFVESILEKTLSTYCLPFEKYSSSK